MTELQVLRNDLLKEWGNIEEAKKAYDFVLNYGEQDTPAVKGQVQTDDTPDGIYIVTIYGAIPFDTNRPKPDYDNIKGIGIKYGSRSLVVALYDDDDKGITLTAKTDKTNAFEQNNLVVMKDNIRVRRLTPTECARLQTIPQWYKWCVSETQQYRMLGNGWTVEVIKHILSFLPDSVKYKSL